MFRFYLNNQEYTPINIGNLSIEITLIEEAGSYYYEYLLTGDPLYNKRAYEYILSHGDGQKIELVITETTPSGVYEIAKAYFTNRDCTEDPKLKQLQCKVKQDSLYRKLVDNYDKTFNFLRTPNVVGAVYEDLVNYEYQVIPVGTSRPPVLPYYGSFVEYSGGGSPFFGFAWYAKETKTVYCIGGEPTPPIGSGWELEIDNCEGKGTATYSRKPPLFDPFPPFGTIDVADTTAIPPVVPVPPPITAANEDWQLIDTITNPSVSISFWINRNDLVQDTKELVNGRTLVDVINFGLNFDVPELDVQSVFLNDSINPVNGESPNTTKDIQLHAISDIKDPDADIKARVEETTLRILLEDVINGKLNSFWRVDERTKRLIIENYKDVFSGNIIDVSGAQLTQRYNYDNSDIPRSEEFPSSDSSIDFKGVPIEYDNFVAQGVKTYNTESIYTEIDQIITDPDTYPQDGIVMICKDSLSPRQILAENGRITGEYAPNIPFATSTLHEKFYPYYRPFNSGILNFNSTSFTLNKPVKVLLDELVYTPCSLYFFDPYAKFQGQNFEEGRLQQGVYNLLTKKLSLKIKYNE